MTSTMVDGRSPERERERERRLGLYGFFTFVEIGTYGVFSVFVFVYLFIIIEKKKNRTYEARVGLTGMLVEILKSDVQTKLDCI